MNAAPIAAGLVPTQLSFYQEDMAQPDAMGDVIARIVVQRFRDARRAKANNSIYQGKSTITLLTEADHAMAKEYTQSQRDVLAAAFGVCPSRFYGVAQAKTTTIADWKAELVASDPGSLIRIEPTPDPRLPEASVKAIKAQVKIDLVRRMAEQGIGDPSMLLSVENGRLHPAVKRFLDERALQLREIEKARVVQAAMTAAAKVQVKMRDAIIEGDFREAYAGFSRAQIQYGLGIMRFPQWKRRVLLADKQRYDAKPRRVVRVVPTFSDVSPWNFFPVNDGRTVGECTAVMEYQELTKTALVELAHDDRYDKAAILDILDTYSFKSRTWLFPEMSSTKSENGDDSTYWGPEEVIAVIHHEGRLTGKDLLEQGLTGYEATRVYEVRAEVCGGRTIRVNVNDPTKELPRSYSAAKFQDLGHGVWNCIGVPAIVHDSEERINTLFRVWEDNADWAMRPPKLTNPEALQNPAQANNIRPGGQYQVSDLAMPGTVPDPIRTMRGPSAQYQIMWPIILQMVRQVDAEVGVPDLADLNTFGRGSLGELSARVAQAVRRIRAAAFSEDRSMKPTWWTLYEHVLDQNPELIENADLDLNYIGVIGLLQKEQERQLKMQALGLARQGVGDGMVPPQVAEYTYHDALTSMGVPVDALGMDDPLVANATAVALQTGTPVVGTGVPMAPQIDGRSGNIAAVPGAVAAPNGGSSMPPPL